MNSIRSSGSITLALTAILLLGFALRIWGISFGLPDLYHADEPIVVNHALAYGSGDLHPHFFRIPPLTSYLLFLFYGLFFLAGKLSGVFYAPSDFERLFYSDPTAFYWIGRVVLGVLPGVLGIFFLYRVTMRIFGEGRALAAALLLAVCFLHVRDSHYIYTDMPLLAVLTAAMGSFFNLLDAKPEASSLKRHLLCGFWIGLAAAFKYNGVFLVVPYGAACLFQAAESKKIPLAGIFLAGLCSLAVFIILNPFAALDFQFFCNELAAEGAAHAGGVPWMHPLLYSALEGTGSLMLGFALAGMVSLIRPQGAPVSIKARFVLLSFVLSYYVVLVLGGQLYDRYTLPLTPFIAFFAADSIFSLTAAVQKPFFKTLLTTGFLLAALFQPLQKSIQLGGILTAGDTRTDAKNWIERHLPKNSGVALSVPFYGPRLAWSEDSLREKLSRIESSGAFPEVQKRRLQFLWDKAGQRPGYRLYQLTHDENPGPVFVLAPEPVPYDAEKLRGLGISYVVVERGHDEARLSAFLKTLPALEPVARFTPFRDSLIAASFDPYAMTGAPFLSKELSARRLAGPLLEVYKLSLDKDPL